MLPGEKYRMAMTDIALSSPWWTFASAEELEGVRLQRWNAPAESEKIMEQLRLDMDLKDLELKNIMTFVDSLAAEEMAREHWEKRERFLNGPVCMSEEPNMLAMVNEVAEVEFEVI
jgi:hypothetical protein